VDVDLLNPGFGAAAIAGVFGLVFGSFLNVCIVRWGAEPKQSVVRPRSRCPRCGSELKPYDNIPVLSWLVLGGNCRNCREPISALYPMVELATGVIWGYMAWRHGITLEALAGAIFFTILLGIAVTDYRAYIIPDEFTLGGLVLLLIFSVSAGGGESAAHALQGAGFGAGVLVAVAIAGEAVFKREAMGGGDIKLMAVVGAMVGAMGTLATLLIGAIVSIVLTVIASLLTSRATDASGVDANPDSAGGPRVGFAAVAALVLAALLVGAFAFISYYGALDATLGALHGGIVWVGWGALAVAYLGLMMNVERVDPFIAGLALPGIVWGLNGGLTVIGLAALLGGIGIWAWQRNRQPESSPAPAPENNEDLTAAGYIPFGVGLSIAAAIVWEVIGVTRLESWAS
jgi:leader peptidase (prepilin peptidase)/N-methyltransferase